MSRLISGNFPVAFISLSLEEILDVPTLVFGLCETQMLCACDVDALWTLRDASDDVLTVIAERCLFRPLLRSSFLIDPGLTRNGWRSFPSISLYFTLALFLLLIMLCVFIELSDLTSTLCLTEPKVVSLSLFSSSVLCSFQKGSKHLNLNRWKRDSENRKLVSGWPHSSQNKIPCVFPEFSLCYKNFPCVIFT